MRTHTVPLRLAPHVLIAILFTLAIPQRSQAQYFWDPAPSTGTNAGGGAGTWNTTDLSWYDGATNVAWLNGSNAVFGGAIGGTVVIGSAGMTVSNLTFNTTGYILDNTNSLEFSAAPTVTVASGATATINTVLTGTIATFTKDGAGTLILGGANTFTTGAAPAGSLVNINAGTLGVSADANLGQARTSVGNQVNLGAGATLQLNATWTWNTFRQLTTPAAAVGIIHLGSTANVTSAALMLGTGGITVTGAIGGNLTLSGLSTYTGNFTLTSGQVTLGANNTLTSGPLGRGTINLTGGTLLTTATRTISNPVVISANVTLSPGVSNGISFTGTTTITNSPTITVSANNLFGPIGAAAIWNLNSDLTIAGLGSIGYTGANFNLGGADRTLTLIGGTTSGVIRNVLNFGGNLLTLRGTGTFNVGSTTGGAFETSGSVSGFVVDGATVIFGGLNSGISSSFTGGVRVLTGIAVAANTGTIGGPPFTSGPFGLGTLRVSGGTVRGLTTIFSIANTLLIDGNAAFGTGGVGLTFTSANQTISGNRILTFGASTTSFTPATGSVVLTGNLTTNHTGAFNAVFGSIDYGSTARTITKSGVGGILTINAAPINIVAGNQLIVTGGVATVTVTDALGNGLSTVTVAPAAAVAATFSLTSIGTTTTLAGNLILGGLGTATSTVEIGANTLRLGGGLIYDVSGNAAAGLATIMGTAANPGLDLGNSVRIFNIGDSTAGINDLTISAPITGNGGGFNKQGLGVMVINTNNSSTFLGGTNTITAGRVIVSIDGALGDAAGGTTVLSGGTLSIGTATYTTAEPITISGSGSAGRGGALETNSNAAIPFAGPVTLGSSATIGNIAGNAFTLSGGIDTALTGYVATFNTTSTTPGIIVTSAIIGAGGVAKIGTGDVRFSVANSYTGGTTIDLGRIIIGDANALGTGLVTINSDGTTANSGNLSIAGTFTVPNNFLINGPGYVTANRMAIDVTSGGTPTVSGTITLGSNASIGSNAASLNLTASGQIATAGFTLYVSGIGDSFITGTITGTGGLFKGNNFGGSIVTGTANLTLGSGVADTAANTYSGSTTLQAGTLTLNKAAGTNAISGNITITGGTLARLASEQIPDTANVTINGGTFFSTAASTFVETIAGVTQTAGQLQTGVDGGTLIITGTANVTGGTFAANSGGFLTVNTLNITGPGLGQVNANSIVNQSVLTVGSGGLTLAGANFDVAANGNNTTLGGRLRLQSNVTSTGVSAFLRTILNTPAVIDLDTGTRTFNVTGRLSVAAPIANGALTKTGTGELILNAINTYTGNTTVNGGMLAGTGVVAGTVAVNPGGTLRGDTGTGIGTLTTGPLTVTGAAGFGAGGTIATYLPTSPPLPAITGNSTIAVGANPVVFDSTAGAFNILLLNDDTLVTGTPYTVTIITGSPGATYTGFSGNFVVLSGSLTHDYTAFSLATSGDNLVLSFTPTVVPEPGTILGLAAMGLGLGNWVRRRRK